MKSHNGANMAAEARQQIDFNTIYDNQQRLEKGLRVVSEMLERLVSQVVKTIEELRQ